MNSMIDAATCRARTWSCVLEAIEIVAAAAYAACGAYLDEGGDWSPVAVALRAFDEAVAAARREHDAARPAGKLPADHPWHAELGTLGDAIRVNRMIVGSIAARAAALRDGRLAEHDAAQDAEVNLESKRFARAAAEIERREARIGHPLDVASREAIVRAYAGR